MVTSGRGSARPSNIDQVLTNLQETVEDVTLGSPLGSSDHSVLHIDYRWTPALEPDNVIYQYKKSNYNKMKNMLDLDWEQIFSE